MCRVGTIFLLGLVGILLSTVALLFRYKDADVECKEYRLPSPPPFTGPLAENVMLQAATHLLEGQLDGPESMVVEGDTIYTTVYDGAVLKIVKGKIVKRVAFTKEKNCGSFDAEPRCGRPLGIRRLTKKEFVVADAYLGIYLVDMEAGSFRRIVDSRVPVAGRPMRFLNDVEVLSEDEILFTDSSSKHGRNEFMVAVFEQQPNGRVFKHKISTGQTTVLLDGLHFANGIQLMPDHQSFLVSECGMARIKRHYIAGPLVGKTAMFAENLPGMPDNVRLSSNSTLWVGLAGSRHSGALSFIDNIGPAPALRQFLVDMVPSRFWIEYFPLIKPPHSLVIQLDLNGQPVSTLHDPSGAIVSDVSQVVDTGSHLYFGSYHNKYIAVLKK